MHVYSLSTPILLKLKLYDLYMQRFLRSSPIFKIIFPLHAEIYSNLQNCQIWARNPEFEKSSRSCIYVLSFYHGGGGGRNSNIFALRAAVSEIQVSFQHCHIWAWNLEFEKPSRSYRCALSTPWVEIELIFTLWYETSDILGPFIRIVLLDYSKFFDCMNHKVLFRNQTEPTKVTLHHSYEIIAPDSMQAAFF